MLKYECPGPSFAKRWAYRTLSNQIFTASDSSHLGSGLVAQRVGMDHLGPFTFNGIRFMLGGLSLLPVLFVFQDKTQPLAKGLKDALSLNSCRKHSFYSCILQQIGLVTTTAGKAAITSLYRSWYRL